MLNYIKSSCANYFQIHILGQMPKKKLTKKLFELHQVFMCDFLCQNNYIFTKILNFIKSLCAKIFQYSQDVYTLKALLSENWIYFFFLIF